MWNIFLKVASAVYRVLNIFALLKKLRRNRKNREDI